MPRFGNPGTGGCTVSFRGGKSCGSQRQAGLGFVGTQCHERRIRGQKYSVPYLDLTSQLK